MVSENNWKSKTFWGFGLAILVGFLQHYGIVADESVIAGVFQALGSLTGLWGARDALR